MQSTKATRSSLIARLLFGDEPSPDELLAASLRQPLAMKVIRNMISYRFAAWSRQI